MTAMAYHTSRSETDCYRPDFFAPRNIEYNNLRLKAINCGKSSEIEYGCPLRCLHDSQSDCRSLKLFPQIMSAQVKMAIFYAE